MKHNLTSRSHFQGFQIVSFACLELEACAQFMFKGYQISFSTIGYSQGGCLNEINVYGKSGDGDNFSDYGDLLSQHNSVEDAILWILGVTDVVDVKSNNLQIETLQSELKVSRSWASTFEMGLTSANIQLAEREEEITGLREVIKELRQSLSPTYELSPEGRQYLSRIDGMLQREEK